MAIAIAYKFHFQPSEIWEMELTEFCFWGFKGIEQINIWEKPRK